MEKRDWPTPSELANAKVRQTLGGVVDAVVCINPPFGKVYVKELTKEQILELVDEWGDVSQNATPFYYSKSNRDRLWELYQEGVLVRRACLAIAFELPKQGPAPADKRRREI